MCNFPPEALFLCKHLGARPRVTDPIGKAHCPACGRKVWLYEVFSNMLDAMQEAINDQRR